MSIAKRQALVSQLACIACSHISQGTAVVAAVAWTGHGQAGGDANEHRGAWSPGTESPVTHSSHSQRAMAISAFPAVASCTQDSKQVSQRSMKASDKLKCSHGMLQR